MTNVATGTSFYRRGVPDSYTFFGQAVQGNYPVVQPQRLFNGNSNVYKIELLYPFNKQYKKN